MKLHPRYQIVTAARHQIGDAVREAIKTHDLTYAELFSVLADVQHTWAKYAIRDERHPDDPDAKGDEE